MHNPNKRLKLITDAFPSFFKPFDFSDIAIAGMKEVEDAEKQLTVDYVVVNPNGFILAHTSDPTTRERRNGVIATTQAIRSLTITDADVGFFCADDPRELIQELLLEDLGDIIPVAKVEIASASTFLFETLTGRFSLTIVVRLSKDYDKVPHGYDWCHPETVSLLEITPTPHHKTYRISAALAATIAREIKDQVMLKSDRRPRSFELFESLMGLKNNHATHIVDIERKAAGQQPLLQEELVEELNRRYVSGENDDQLDRSIAIAVVGGFAPRDIGLLWREWDLITRIFPKDNDLFAV